MNRPGDKSPVQKMLGFLTVLEHDQHGLIGGYLLLTATGRPLEFHCTAPVKATRAQQILFGKTLGDFLYGEHIGQTLVAKGSSLPSVVFTDVIPALSVGQFVECPVVLVLSPALSSTPEMNGLDTFPLGVNRLAVALQVSRERVAGVLEGLDDFDCHEPFGRIREAIEEAQRSTAAKAA
jgi:hypothetical protein